MHPPFNDITSRQNQYVQYARHLHDRKARASEKACLAEGVKVLAELSPASNPIRFMFISKDKVSDIPQSLSPVISQASQILVVDRRIMDYISTTETPDGFLAVVETAPLSSLEPEIDGDSFFLILDSIRDPGNLGTIFRTAYAAGTSAIILFDENVDAYNAKTIRASAGTVFRLPFFSISRERLAVLERSKAKGLRIAASVSRASEAYWDFDYSPPLAFVLGSESHGISETLISLCDTAISIPMEKAVDSLNVSVSASLLCYKFLEKKNRAKW